MKNKTWTGCCAMRRLLLIGYLVLHCCFAYSSLEILPVMARYELNSNTIYDIFCSRTGYIWLTTDVGISRYDGFRFRNFPLISTSDSLAYPASWAVRTVAEDENDMLYLILMYGGMACFDEKVEAYIPVKLEGPFTLAEITSVFLGDGRSIYVGTKSGLYKGVVDRIKEDKMETVRIRLSAEPAISGGISDICGDNNGIFVCVNKSEIWEYSLANDKAKVLQGYEAGGEAVSLYLGDRYLWACSLQGSIKCYDRKQKMQVRVIDDKRTSGQLALSDTRIRAITAVNEKIYYIATWNGLFRLAFDTKDIAKANYTLEALPRESDLSYPGLRGKLSDVYWSESQNILWVATYGSGIMKFDYMRNAYNRVSQHFDTDIVDVEQDMQGYVWVAVRQRGIWKSTTKQLSVNTLFEPWTKGVDPAGTYRLYRDRNGFLWLGDESSKVVCVNPSNGEMVNYSLLPAKMRDFSAHVQQFCVDTRDRLWVVTTEGLLLSDSKTGKCELVALDADDASVKNVFSIAEDKDGDIWLGTNCGLRRMEFLNGKVKLHGGYEKKAGVDILPVFSIYVNSYNQVFASYPNRILRIDRRGRKDEEEEVAFTVMNRMNSGYTFCMLDDLNGNTWLGDNSGVITLRNDRNLFYKYPLTGGCDEGCRLQDGRLLWVNAGGLLFFDPLEIKSNKNQNRLMLSGLEVNGELIAVGQQVHGRTILDTAPCWQDKFVFYPENADITFFFSDLQYNGELRKMAYRLLPDEEWNVSSLEAGISYKQLPVGDYVLQVKLMYPDASESKVVELPVVMKNNWWKTSWAYTGYIFLFLMALLGVYYYLVRKARKRGLIKMRELELQEKLNSEKIKRSQRLEMENVRDRLLALFVQNLRTPLSLIIAPLKELFNDQLPTGALAKVHVAYRNSVGMLDACDQLLAIYTEKPLEEKLKVSLCPVDKLINEIVFSVKELVRINQIDFQCNRKIAKDLKVYADYRRICFVLHNLLSNAFNHIRFTGVVTLSVAETVVGDVRYCMISVLDSGKSKVREMKQSMFEEEEDFLTDISAIELGYEMMEKIVRLHHGFMNMESSEGGYNEVRLNIPIEKKMLEGDPNIVFVEPEEQEEPKKTQQQQQENAVALLPEPVAQENIAPVVSGPAPTAKKKTLLVVEDHKDIRLYLKVLFSSEYNILVAVNGQEGIDLAQREQPDLILCDVMMPVKDGLQCCKELKEGVDTCHIPFILLTAMVEDDDVIHGLEMGADDYILKPFTPGILKARVRNLISGRVTLKQMYTRLLVLPEENETKEGQEEKVEDPFISMVVKIVEDNIKEADFSVKKLAAEMNMSQPTLYRKIKQTTDFTIIELIRGVRMRKAATLLKQKKYAVQEVAEMVGYNDIPTFRKHFVDTFGTTPSTYANMVEEGGN